MSNLEDIIKQKVDQFDVPFNEAHWEAMEAKLHAIKMAKIRKNIFIAAGVITIISVVSIFLYNPKTTPEQISNHTNEATINSSPIKVNSNSDKEIVVKTNNNQPTNNSSQELKLEKETPIQTPTITIDENTQKLLAETPQENKITSRTLSAEFIVYNNRICLGEEVSFEVIERKNVTYQWSFGDGTTSTKANPKHTYLNDGVYTVSLTVTDINSGKNVSNEVKRAVEILPLPNAEFSSFEEAEKHDDNKLKYPYTSFVAKDKELEAYTWNFGNGQTDSQHNPKIIFDKKGSFKTTLMVRNSFGCVNSLSKIITIDFPFNLFAPNAFSPNYDGENDTFIPKALLAWDVQFEMLIKNKAGDVVFKSTDKYNGWNGKLNNTGADLDPGIYFWQVITFDADGNPHQHFGKINLIK
ncbi:MAG: PKD domain-containing protein [Flavobacteriales bacterium]|nr:PKD domain-containing protein [Flavobacteriales bacterium]MCB9364418.1 PKD domain-containing protein [Flavobacteriales bacterium]